MKLTSEKQILTALKKQLANAQKEVTKLTHVIAVLEGKQAPEQETVNVQAPGPIALVGTSTEDEPVTRRKYMKGEQREALGKQLVDIIKSSPSPLDVVTIGEQVYEHHNQDISVQTIARILGELAADRKQIAIRKDGARYLYFSPRQSTLHTN